MKAQARSYPRSAPRPRRLGALGLALLALVPAALPLAAETAESAQGLYGTVVIVPTPSVTALFPGVNIKVYLYDDFGNNLQYERANVGVAFFAFEDLAYGYTGSLNPREALSQARWSESVANVDLRNNTEGYAEFVFPGIPGAYRMPGVLWAYYDNAAVGGAAYDGYYAEGKQTLRFYDYPLNGFGPLGKAFTPVFANEREGDIVTDHCPVCPGV